MLVVNIVDNPYFLKYVKKMYSEKGEIIIFMFGIRAFTHFFKMLSCSQVLVESTVS